MSGQLTGSTPVIVALPAEIDLSNAEQVYDQLSAALASGAAVVIADFTGTRFCDCACLNRLLRVHNQAGRPQRPAPPGDTVRRAGAGGRETARTRSAAARLRKHRCCTGRSRAGLTWSPGRHATPSLDQPAAAGVHQLTIQRGRAHPHDLTWVSLSWLDALAYVTIQWWG